MSRYMRRIICAPELSTVARLQVSAGAGLIVRVAGSEEGMCPVGLVSRQQIDADVGFYVLWLEDADDTSERDEPEDDSSFVAACGQRVYLQSGGHTHTPALSVEVWDGQPPADGGVWEAQGEAGMDVPSGQVSVWTYGGPCEDAIEVGEAGRRWHVRVYVSGRDRARELAQQEVPVHAERYLLQFWPA
ncbi:hypothetical protein ACWCOW_40245 [Streptomyces sp. NPDC001939]